MRLPAGLHSRCSSRSWPGAVRPWAGRGGISGSVVTQGMTFSLSFFFIIFFIFFFTQRFSLRKAVGAHLWRWGPDNFYARGDVYVVPATESIM